MSNADIRNEVEADPIDSPPVSPSAQASDGFGEQGRQALGSAEQPGEVEDEDDEEEEVEEGDEDEEEEESEEELEDGAGTETSADGHAKVGQP